MRNLIDPPGRSSKDERVSISALEDHLLIQFAHPHRLASLSGEKKPIRPAIRDRPSVHDGNPLHSSPRGNPVSRPVPCNPWPQIGKLIRWIPPGQHIQYTVEDTLTQPCKRRSATHQRKQRSITDPRTFLFFRLTFCPPLRIGNA